eukprot:4301774-Pyramimonas_sp.AAC.1
MVMTMRVHRKAAGILEATLETQFPQCASHIGLDVRCQRVQVDPLTWSVWPNAKNSALRGEFAIPRSASVLPSGAIYWLL